MRRHGGSSADPILTVRGISKTFFSQGLFTRRGRVGALQDVGFDMHRGEAIALVGESGSGKSTLARILLRLERPDSGEIRLDGENVLARETRGASLAYRGRVQMVFQDPFGSLNPVHNIAHHLERPILRHGALNPARPVSQHPEPPLDGRRGSSGNALRARALELLRTVGLEPAEEFIHRHPYELSGGQRQRVAIARALAVDPDVLVADEPTSMLDVSIRMDILNLLAGLKRDRGLAVLLITHDLASARYLADRILVLFRGRVVEDGPAGVVVDTPAHPYTRALLDSIADADGASPAARQAVPPAVPDVAPTGCPFASRCPEVVDLCRSSDPGPRPVEERNVRCHLYPETVPGHGDAR